VCSAADGGREEAQAWLAKAEQDLVAAQILRDRAGPATVACFLCQQAIEKTLKSLLCLLAEIPPRTHDLMELSRRLGGRCGDLGVSLEELAVCTDYSVAARYPGFGDPKAERDLPGSPVDDGVGVVDGQAADRPSVFPVRPELARDSTFVLAVKHSGPLGAHVDHVLVARAAGRQCLAIHVLDPLEGERPNVGPTLIAHMEGGSRVVRPLHAPAARGDVDAIRAGLRSGLHQEVIQPRRVAEDLLRAIPPGRLLIDAVPAADVGPLVDEARAAGHLGIARMRIQRPGAPGPPGKPVDAQVAPPFSLR
jgi:HEPN domain-containing protein